MKSVHIYKALIMTINDIDLKEKERTVSYNS